MYWSICCGIQSKKYTFAQKCVMNCEANDAFLFQTNNHIIATFQHYALLFFGSETIYFVSVCVLGKWPNESQHLWITMAGRERSGLSLQKCAHYFEFVSVDDDSTTLFEVHCWSHYEKHLYVETVERFTSTPECNEYSNL